MFPAAVKNVATKSISRQNVTISNEPIEQQKKYTYFFF